MKPERAIRGGLLLAGLLLGVFGAWSLLRLGLSNLLWTILWLAGGIVAHDALVAGAALGLLAVGVLVVPSWARAAAATGLLVLGTVTIMAIPVLGRFGAIPDNPSLLDRSYGVGWLVFAGIVAAGVVAAAFLARQRQASQAERSGAPAEDRHG